MNQQGSAAIPMENMAFMLSLPLMPAGQMGARRFMFGQWSRRVPARAYIAHDY